MIYTNTLITITIEEQVDVKVSPSINYEDIYVLYFKQRKYLCIFIFSRCEIQIMGDTPSKN